MKLILLVSFLLCFQWAGSQSVDTSSLLPTLDSVDWISIKTDSGVIHAAIAIPEGKAPFPAIIILHGTHGFAREYVHLAQEFAKNGIVGIAACWFAGRKGGGQKFITPIDFNDAPPLVDAPGEDRFRIARVTIDSLVRKISTLPYVKTNQLALFGHSRGGGASLNYVLTHPFKVQVIILNSTGYPADVIRRASEVDIPVLIIHGTENNPDEGGSPLANIEMARQFETALRTARKDIQVKYFEGSGHNALFSNSAQFDGTVKQVVTFLLKKLSN
jgi:alpha-beta hydrolase superfamily lysophospholipase